MLGKQPEQLVWLLLTILAVWRVTAFLAYERGPWGLAILFRRICVRIGLGGLVGCFYCLSVWISCGALLVFAITPAAPLIVLGVAGAVAIIERFLSRDATTSGEQHEL